VRSSLGQDGRSGKNTVEFKAKEVDSVLINPFSGMVNYGIEISYGVREVPHYIFPEAIVYLRPAWAELEPQEGVLDLARFEKIRDEHLRGGALQWAFRIVTVQPVDKWKNAAPEWLQKSGAKGTVAKNKYWEPQYGDSIYQAKFGRFIGKIAERYDGDPRLAFVDISGLGLYSEWGDPETNQVDWKNEAKKQEDLRGLINIFLKAFKKTPLAISTHIIGPQMQDRYEVMYALKRGALPRRDGLGSPFFHEGHKALVQKLWPDRPIITEMYAI
jgi:hypothetical protein